ncbi:nucleotidyltransferase family protein [Asticcacaulis sp. AC402]|uniref:nucleotidyltransferase family protein n=1 Tax=Asticcacaulis sp. AC402 TaxID=1282361 RepID=UPI0003C3F26B|nr:nucleotidyltransferase domain-containing protein [Asticcacaulis sp. AC402]ESQ75028.1 hypothetical protein ABAC402_11530 [Asticcacaulis sp. AC402]
MIIAALRAHQSDLRALGVEGLSLFGSVARGEETPASDVDLAVVYNEAVVRDLYQMGGVAAAIESFIGTDNFDLAEEKRMPPHIRTAYAQDHVRIF